MEYFHIGATGGGVIALSYVLCASRQIISAKTGSSEIKQVVSTIQEESINYLNRQHIITISGCVLIAVILSLWLHNLAAGSFIVGVFLAGGVGYMGMLLSLMANGRMSQVARLGIIQSSGVAIMAAAAVGMLVLGGGLLGVMLYGDYYLLSLNITTRLLLESLIALSFGASVVSLSSQLGGVIFANGAALGRDLIGNLEGRMLEQAPPTLEFITSKVRGNVAKGVGTVTDLFGLYVVSLIIPFILAILYFSGTTQRIFLAYPFLIGSAGIMGSIAGAFLVRANQDKGDEWALHKALIMTSLVSSGLIWVVTHYCFRAVGTEGVLKTLPFTEGNILTCALLGIVVTLLLVGGVTYYSSPSYRPVQKIAENSFAGQATNILQGMSFSMGTTVFPMVVISIAILISFTGGGLYGIAILTTSMLSLAGIMALFNTYGVVMESARGIAEVTLLNPTSSRLLLPITLTGNTAKAITKNYTALASFLIGVVLFGGYVLLLMYYFPGVSRDFNLINPFIITGLLVGCLLSYLFGAVGIKAVWKVIDLVVRERGGEKRENSINAIPLEIWMKLVIREMAAPFLLPIILPGLLYLIIGTFVDQTFVFSVLGAIFMGMTIVGGSLALFTTIGGEAWDNAKTYIEAGNLGGEKSHAHQAAITGARIGHPCKYLAGDALNSMIRTMNLAGLLLLAIVSL